ncbi:MAG: hypothetical protein ABIK37_06065 [candidate division WOR-3 bacterium]
MPAEPDDRAIRRWRLAVTIGAWFLIVQAGYGLLSGILSLVLAPLYQPRSLLNQLGPFVDRSGLAVIESISRQSLVLARVQLAASGLLLAGAIGLLARRKWAWFLVTLLHVAAAVMAIVWGQPMLEQLLVVFDPAGATALSVLLSIALALAPASVVVFLLLQPVLRQFEPASRPQTQA